MRYKILAAGALIVVAVFTLIVLAARGNKPRRPQPAADRAAAVQSTSAVAPPLISKTRDAGVYIEDVVTDQEHQALVVFVRNDTDKNVESFLVQGGDELQGAHGGTLPGQPPAIAPHSVAQVAFSLRNESLLHRPIVLKAAVFADGMGAGEKEDRDAAAQERQKVFDVHARDGVPGAAKGAEKQR